MFSFLKKIFRRKTVGYVSSVDRFSAKWDATHPNSASQKAEIKKYQLIYALRDKTADKPKKKK